MQKAELLMVEMRAQEVTEALELEQQALAAAQACRTPEQEHVYTHV